MADKNLELALRIKALVDGVKDIEHLTSEMQELGNEARKPIPDPTKPITTGAHRATPAVSGLANAFRALAMLEIARQFITANAAIESSTLALKTLTGSEEAAAAEMEYILSTAQRLGQPITETASAYTQLAAASKGTTLEGQATRDIFEAITQTMATMGASSAETENALRAVAQMMSKGTVSAEELKGQLGEALPGALQAAAQGMGYTVEQLNKLVESGGLAADEMLPQLAAQLKANLGAQATGQVDTFSASWTRLINSVQVAYSEIGQSGPMQAASAWMSGVTTAINVLTVGFISAGKYIGATAAALQAIKDLSVFDFSGVAKAFSETFSAAQEDIQKTADKIFNLDANLKVIPDSAKAAGLGVQEGMRAATTGAEAAQTKVMEMGRALATLGMDDPKVLTDTAHKLRDAWLVVHDEFKKGGVSVEQVRSAFLAYAEAAIKAATATGETVSPALQARAAQLGLSDQLAELIEQYQAANPAVQNLQTSTDQLSHALANEVRISESAAEVKVKEHQAREQVYRLLGLNAAAQQEAARAAQAEIQALRTDITNRQKEVQAIQAQLAALAALENQQGQLTAQQKQQQADLTTNLKLKQDEIKTAENSLQVKQAEGQQSQQNTETTQENTEAIEENTEARQENVEATQAMADAQETQAEAADWTARGMQGISVAAVEMGGKLYTAFGKEGIEAYNKALAEIKYRVEAASQAAHAMQAALGESNKVNFRDIIEQAGYLRDAIGNSRGYMDDLIAQTRDELTQVIAEATQAMRDFAAEEQAALEDARFRLALLRAEGNKVAEENIRFAKDRAELEERLASAQASRNQEAIAALREELAIEQAMHEIRLKRLRESDSGRATTRTGGTDGGAGASRTLTVQLRGSGGRSAKGEFSDQDAEAFLKILNEHGLTAVH